MCWLIHGPQRITSDESGDVPPALVGGSEVFLRMRPCVCTTQHEACKVCSTRVVFGYRKQLAAMKQWSCSSLISSHFRSTFLLRWGFQLDRGADESLDSRWYVILQPCSKEVKKTTRERQKVSFSWFDESPSPHLTFIRLNLVMWKL